MKRRNCLTAEPNLLIIVILVILAALTVGIIVLLNRNTENPDTFDADQEKNVSLYFTDDSTMLGTDLVDGMSRLSGSKIIFRVTTLAGNTQTYNYGSVGKVPEYNPQISKTSAECINPNGVFEITLNSVDGIQTVTAVQRK